MKKLLLLTFIASSALTFGQDLSKKLSERSNYLFTINGGVITDKVSAEEISSSEAFNIVIHEFLRGHAEVKNLNELGVNYNERIFFSSEYGNDVQFNIITYKIKDKYAFEKLVNSSRYEPTFEVKNGLNILSYDNESKLVWNDAYALLITADYIGQEFSVWGWYDDYYYDAVEEADYAYTEEIAVEAVEEMDEEAWKEHLRLEDEKREKERLEREERRAKEEKEKAEKKTKREAFTAEALNKRIDQFFSDDLLNSGKHIQLKLDEAAAVTFWYPNSISLMDPFFYGVGYGYRPYSLYGGLFGMTNFFNGRVIANGYIEETQLRMDLEMTYYGDLEETYSKIFSQKIDKSYGNFLSDNDLGFMSISANTEEILNEYPKLIQGMMGVYDSTYTDEYQLFAELFSIAVDEEAISELITGDALFIMNDIGMKEVTKYVYEYDEEYNYERVLKTQMELTPDFSFISGTNRPDIIQKFIDLGLKHKVLEPEGKGYKFNDKYNEFPIPVFVAFTDEHLIFTSDKNKMTEYQALSKGEVSKNKKNLLLKNNGAFYLNVEDLITKMLLSDAFRGSEKRIFEAMRTEVSTIQAYMKYENDGNHIVATAPVPATEENGAAYLLHFFNKMILAEKRR